MNTPDTITITISRGRWSISRCMDLDLMDVATLDASEHLFDLYQETRYAFTLAGRHLDPLWNNAPIPADEEDRSPSSPVPLHKTSDDPGTTGP